MGISPSSPEPEASGYKKAASRAAFLCMATSVIGGSIYATVSTLMFIPVVFTLIHSRIERLAAPQWLVTSGRLGHLGYRV